MSMQESSNQVVLPPGVTVVGNRETSQPNAQGQIVPGVSFTLQLPNGSTTSVFIPYAILNNPTTVSQIIQQRVAAVQSVLNATPGR